MKAYIVLIINLVSSKIKINIFNIIIISVKIFFLFLIIVYKY